MHDVLVMIGAGGTGEGVARRSGAGAHRRDPGYGPVWRGGQPRDLRHEYTRQLLVAIPGTERSHWNRAGDRAGTRITRRSRHDDPPRLGRFTRLLEEAPAAPNAELAATATSRTNGCTHCASAHPPSAARESGRHDDVQRLLDQGVGADLGSETWNAIAHAADVLTRVPLDFGPEEIGRLRAAGLSDAEIVDVINGAAFFNWANRLMLSLGEPEVPTRRADRA